MFKKMFKKIALVACVASLAVGTIAVANAGSYNAEFGAFFNDPDPANDSDDGGWLNLGDAAKTTFTDDGSVATITVELAEERSFEGHYAAILTDYPFDEEDLPDAKLVSLKLDGKEYTPSAQFLNQEGLELADKSVGLRINICNHWNNKIEEQPIDLDTEAMKAVKFKKIEVSFSVKGAAEAESSSSTVVESSSATTDNNTKTGDSTMVAVLAVVAVLALAGVAVTSKKRA